MTASTVWSALRADLARPEQPVPAEERLFLFVSAAVVLAGTLVADPGNPREILLASVAAATLALRGVLTSLPSELFAAVIAVASVAAVSPNGHVEVVFFLGVLVTLYAAGQLRSTVRAVLVTVISASAPIVTAQLVDDLSWMPWVAANGFMFVMGRNLQRQRDLIAQLEAAREALAEHAVAEERRRIARELHDLAGHTLAAVLLHVTGARHVLRRDVDEAERALLDAESVGRASLDQIRATVAQLRTSERGTDAPTADASDIDALVEEYRRAGLDVRGGVSAEAVAVAGPVATAAHRICREALTKVARHAPTNRAEVSVKLDEARRELLLEVSDHGRPATVRNEGGRFGLVGMRERAVALGGSFSAGPTAGGWKVEARLPLVASTDAEAVRA